MTSCCASCSASTSRSSRCCTSRRCRGGRGTTGPAACAHLVDAVGAGPRGAPGRRRGRIPLLQRGRPAVPDRCRPGGRGGHGGGDRRRCGREIPGRSASNLVWDPIASLAVARATGASFVREVFTGVFESDLGMMRPDFGAIAAYRRAHRRAASVAHVRQHHPRVREHRRQPSLDRGARPQRGLPGRRRDPHQRADHRDVDRAGASCARRRRRSRTRRCSPTPA